MCSSDLARTKSLQRFKTLHVNNVVRKYLKSERGEDENTVMEYVKFKDILLGTFIFDKKTNSVTFKEEPDNVVSNQG